MRLIFIENKINQRPKIRKKIYEQKFQNLKSIIQLQKNQNNLPKSSPNPFCVINSILLSI